MAVTKTLTGAIPYNKSSKVQQWDFTMQYEDGADATYYTSTFNTTIPASETLPDGSTQTNFTPKAEASWTLVELTALCPISHWDTVFASQYDSMVPPPDNPVPDPDYVIPS
jgi:pterin-4a-carbinolamine dehydratase